MSQLPQLRGRRQRLRRFVRDYLRSVARSEWQLGLLAVVGIAPGVATLLAWINLAVALRAQQGVLLLGWLLPETLLDRLGAEGVLIGAGMVTLLIGCLGLTNAYLASLDRRRPALQLLRGLGLRYQEVLQLLTLEGLAIALLGGGVGLVLGGMLSRLTWTAAAAYLALPVSYHLTPLAPLIAFGVGLLAVLLFLRTAAQLSLRSTTSRHVDRPAAAQHLVNRNSWLGAGYGVILTWIAGSIILPLNAALLLALLSAIVGTLLNGGGWLLTHLYRRLPLSPRHPLWTLAVQGLARHPNHTAGMTLAMTAGAYAVGLAGLSWLASRGVARFPFWVAALILLAGATLVFTVAALAVLERRGELGLLQALGARRGRLWQLVLLEYGIVAIGGGGVGACMALVNWVAAGQREQWWTALALILLDLCGALATAWLGATPVLWQVMGRGSSRVGGRWDSGIVGQ
ncbi:MAG TPA: hypothetical protein P5121_04860 [Caldilineaceae bacterium]|nr:hypothetical protein [Caldilineaceae bacterium]